MKPSLLFLCHRIPYPPNKGDKIRSYHLLGYLNQHYRVFLGAFIDEESDWDYVARVNELCEETCFIRLNPRKARVKSLAGLITHRPLTLPYYANRQLAGWIKRIVDEQEIKRLIVYSSAMAQYVLDSDLGIERRVIDFVDVDSDKWRQYAGKKSWPMSWIYRREADRLLHFERKVAACYDASLFVSSAEAEAFRQLSPHSGEKVDFYNNGVDTAYFSPDRDYPNPYPEGTAALVFTGAMDYWPNIDAVIWFAKEIFPIIRQTRPDLRFYIVGSKPSEAVSQLEREPGIVVTGRVEDVRPYLAHAVAAVAPMRIARGIQNKVLEAMAMAKPTIVTSMGLEGISANDSVEVHVANDAPSFARKIDMIFDGMRMAGALGATARAKVCREFTWEGSLPRVRKMLENTPTEISSPENVVSECG